MSSPRSSEDAEGHRPVYYVDAEDNEDDDHDPDYEDNEEEDDEVDEDDMEHDLFEEEDEFHGSLNHRPRSSTDWLTCLRRC